jgi:hypothetical protein
MKNIENTDRFSMIVQPQNIINLIYAVVQLLMILLAYIGKLGKYTFWLKMY